jgi:glycyl-tRNA synthetase (class II)
MVYTQPTTNIRDSDNNLYDDTSTYTSFNQPAGLTVQVEIRQLESFVAMLERIDDDIVNVNDDDELDEIHSAIEAMIDGLQDAMLDTDDDDSGDDDYDPMDLTGKDATVTVDGQSIETTSVTVDWSMQDNSRKWTIEGRS